MLHTYLLQLGEDIIEEWFDRDPVAKVFKVIQKRTHHFEINRAQQTLIGTTIAENLVDLVNGKLNVLSVATYIHGIKQLNLKK